MIKVQGKDAEKHPRGKPATKKPMTTAERDAEDKRIAEMMYPTSKKDPDNAKGAAT